MRKPKPKKNSECDRCLKIKPLLMPIGFAPGCPVIVWDLVCWECRTAEQVSRYSNSYYMPAYHLEHSAKASDRELYQKWLEVDLRFDHERQAESSDEVQNV